MEPGTGEKETRSPVITHAYLNRLLLVFLGVGTPPGVAETFGKEPGSSRLCEYRLTSERIDVRCDYHVLQDMLRFFFFSLKGPVRFCKMYLSGEFVSLGYLNVYRKETTIGPKRPTRGTKGLEIRDLTRLGKV